VCFEKLLRNFSKHTPQTSKKPVGLSAATQYDDCEFLENCEAIF